MDQAESNFVDLPDFAAPPGGATGIVRTSDGLGLRYMRWAGRPQGPGTIVIATGRSEFIEKYFEVIGELLQRGFCIVVFDWRGQGLPIFSRAFSTVWVWAGFLFLAGGAPPCWSADLPAIR